MLLSKVMALTSADVRETVTQEDDFGHELRVGRVLRGHCAGRLKHGGTYVDCVLGKPRQFDLRWQFDVGTTVLHLAVECKDASADAPIILCGTQRSPSEAFHMLVESFPYYDRGGNVERLVDGLSSITKEARGYESFYQPDNFVAKSVVRMRPDKNDKKKYVAASDTDIYDKWSQALASAVDLTIHSCDLARIFGQQHIFSLIVVPNSVLWTVYYDFNGNIKEEPSQTNSCEFFVGREITFGGPGFRQRFSFSHVHFFTLSGFADFLVDITRAMAIGSVSLRSSRRRFPLNGMKLLPVWVKRISSNE